MCDHCQHGLFITSDSYFIMARRQQVNETLRANAVNLRKQGFTITSIANQLNRSKSVISRIVKLYNETGRLRSPKKVGRPRKTSPREDRIMQRLSLKDRFQSAAGISRQVGQDNDIQVSRQTTSRRLQEIGLFARSPVKKPLISKKNKAARLAFANKHVIWNDDNWSRVFFSDESKFNIFGSDGKNYVRRRVNERLLPKCIKKTVKFGGGSVMLFGMFSSQGTHLLCASTVVLMQLYIQGLVAGSCCAHNTEFCHWGSYLHAR